MGAVAFLNDYRTSVTNTADEQATQIGVERVLAVREMLFEGRYCVEERLDAVLDRILEDLLQ